MQEQTKYRDHAQALAEAMEKQQAAAQAAIHW